MKTNNILFVNSCWTNVNGIVSQCGLDNAMTVDLIFPVTNGISDLFLAYLSGNKENTIDPKFPPKIEITYNEVDNVVIAVQLFG